MPVSVQCQEMLGIIKQRVACCEGCASEIELAALRRIVNAFDGERAVIGRLCELPTLEDDEDELIAEERHGSD